MNPAIFDEISCFDERELLLDTNLCVVWIIGSCSPSLVGQVTKTEGYIPQHYELLNEVVRRFRAIRTTPNIMTEISNLLWPVARKSAYGREIRENFYGYVRFTKEIYSPTESTLDESCLGELGVADTVNKMNSGNDTLLLTADGRLYKIVRSRGLPAINFWNYAY